MSFARVYLRVLGLLSADAPLAVTLAAGEYRARRGAIRRAGAVRPHRRCAVWHAAGRHPACGPGIGAAAWRLGRVRAVHHRRRHGDRLVRRPAGAPAPQPGAGGLFRARAAAAAGLSHRRAFRPADEDHAVGHRHAVVAVGLVLPRAFRRLRLHRALAAGDARAELAAGAAADRAVRRLHRADRAGHAAGLRDAAHGRAALFGSRRDRRRRARQCRAGAKLCARRARSVAAAQPGGLAVAGADAGAVVVGGGQRADARRHHAHAARDPPGRDLSQAGRACFGRRDRQLHEHRRAV